MNKTLKLIIIGIISAIFCYAFYFIFSAVNYGHALDWGTKAKDYLYFFKDSVRSDLDSNYSISYVQKNDIYNHYIYQNIYYITIWEFKNSEPIKLNNIKFNKTVSLADIKFSAGQTINTHSSPEITMAYRLKFDDGMQISYDEDSEVDSMFRSGDYIGCYGNIKKMLLRNIQWQPQVLFDYSNDRQYGLFIFYKKGRSLYILIINSDEPFAPHKLINIFNLS